MANLHLSHGEPSRATLVASIMDGDGITNDPTGTSRIVLTDEGAVDYWTDILCLTVQQLHEAVATVGSETDAVKRHLNRV